MHRMLTGLDARPSRTAAAPPPLIAVLDDEEPVRRALRRLLIANGLRVQLFATGDALLAALPRLACDCVLVDLHMPDLDGVDVLRRLADQPQPPPTIALSGTDDAQLRARATALATVCLPKPAGSDELLEAIDQAMLSRG